MSAHARPRGSLVRPRAGLRECRRAAVLTTALHPRLAEPAKRATWLDRPFEGGGVGTAAAMRRYLLRRTSGFQNPERQQRVLSTRSGFRSIAFNAKVIDFGCCRPQADGQGGDPISIVGTYAEPVKWPVFGKQVDDYNASTQPGAVGGYLHPIAAIAGAELI